METQSHMKYLWKSWPFKQKPEIVEEIVEEIVFGGLLKLSENPVVKVLLIS